MYGYSNEEAAWQRVCDLQREMENSRLMADGVGRGWTRVVGWTRAVAHGAFRLALGRPRPAEATVSPDWAQGPETTDAA
jgi:hypothetical protein